MAYSPAQIKYLQDIYAQGYRGESFTNAMTALNSDQGDVLASQQAHFSDTYVPVEKELMGRLSDPNAANAAGAKAGDLAAQSGVLTREDFLRDWNRRGAGMSAETGAALDRHANLTDALEITNAANSARGAAFDYNLNAMTNAIGTGRGVAASATDQATTASGLSSARASANNAAAAQAKAQDQAAKQQTISTAVGATMAVGTAAAIVL